ncbi:MAG: hypothetical protein ABJB76_07820 [Candidatus Nitrosocosmicus sp.]
MKARREQVDEKLLVIKLFAINYARDLIYNFRWIEVEKGTYAWDEAYEVILP